MSEHHCWHDLGGHSTCMLLDGHDGPHEYTPDSDITVRLAPDPPSQPVPPLPHELWSQAGGDREKYLALMREHGHIIPGKPEPLQCGWMPGPHPFELEDDSDECPLCGGKPHPARKDNG